MPKNYRRWTDEEIKYLKENYTGDNVEELCEHFGRSFDSVIGKINFLGIRILNPHPWTDEEDDYLRENYLLLTKKELAKNLNKTFHAVCGRLETLGLNNKIRRWTEEEISFLRDNYHRLSSIEIGDEIGISAESVRWKAHKLKIFRGNAHSKFKYNEDFFDAPNPINSYFAGLIAADGNVRKGNRNQITLHQKDITVIDQFKEHLGYTGKTILRTNKDRGNSVYSLSFSSKKIKEDLEKHFNIIPAKSLILKPPTKLNRLCSLCYIIGYLDGDGWISIVNLKNNRQRLSFGITGTYEVCDWIRNITFPDLRIGSQKTVNTIYTLRGSNSRAEKFLYLLDDIEEVRHLRMNRKWDKVVEWRKQCN